MVFNTTAPEIQIDHHEDEERGRAHNRPAEKSREGRTSSISAIVDRFRSRSRSHSRPRHPTDGPFDEEDEENDKRDSRRKSTELRGDYAATLKAQRDYMEKLRAEQSRSGVTHNVDGIPLPQSRRRSIISSFSRGNSRSREPSLERSSRSKSRTRDSSEEKNENKPERPRLDDDKEYRHSHRKSVDITGPYAGALQSQLEYMEALREEQIKSGVTHNADGILIPPPTSGRRRSIIAALSRGTSRSREPSLDRTTSRSASRNASRSASRTRAIAEDEVDNHDRLKVDADKEYKYSRRKSAEISGPYATALQSQLDFMETLREDQTKKGITHNADGILIPGPVNNNTSTSTPVSAFNKMQI